MATETLDTNLLQSARRSKGGEEAPLSPAARRKKLVLKSLAYGFFFFVSLIFFTLIKIPDSAIANYLLNSANQQSTTHNFSAEKVSVRFFPLPHLEIEKLGMDPRFPGAGIPLSFDEVTVYPNPFVLGVRFRAEAYKSTFTGSASMNSFHLESAKINLATMPLLAQMGFDLKGAFSNLLVQLSTQSQRLATADGEIRLQGSNLVYDPDALEVLLRENLRMEMSLPDLNLGDLDMLATVNNGTVRVDKLKLGGANKDLEVQVASGTVTLSDAMPLTKYELHVLVKLSPSLEKSVPTLGSMLTMMSTKRADGFYGIKIAGKLSDPMPSIKKE